MAFYQLVRDPENKGRVAVVFGLSIRDSYPWLEEAIKGEFGRAGIDISLEDAGRKIALGLSTYSANNFDLFTERLQGVLKRFGHAMSSNP